MTKYKCKIQGCKWSVTKTGSKKFRNAMKAMRKHKDKKHTGWLKRAKNKGSKTSKKPSKSLERKIDRILALLAD